jgi:hypothetical protein
MTNQNLLQQSTEHVEHFITTANHLESLKIDELNWKETNTSWSILECIEHLNLYGDFYIPAIEKALKKSNTTNDKQFRSGWLGNYFAKSMLPKEKLNKMKTFADKNPSNSQLDYSHIERFINQQKQLLVLFEQAKDMNLQVRLPITISKIIRLKLGDVILFNVYHTIRHMAQIERIKKEYAKHTKSLVHH